MKTAPLQVNRIFFSEVHILNSSSTSSNENVIPDFEIDPTVQPRKEGCSEWCVVLRVLLKPKEGTVASYVGKIETIGLFTVDEVAWTIENREKLVFTNGAAILYSATREMVLNITSRGLFPPIMLPSCSFNQIYQDRQNEKKDQETQSA